MRPPLGAVKRLHDPQQLNRLGPSGQSQRPESRFEQRIGRAACLAGSRQQRRQDIGRQGRQAQGAELPCEIRGLVGRSASQRLREACAGAGGLGGEAERKGERQGRARRLTPACGGEGARRQEASQAFPVGEVRRLVLEDFQRFRPLPELQ